MNRSKFRRLAFRSMRTSRRRALGATALGGVALALAACSGRRRSTTSPGSSTAQGKPQSGGKVNVAIATPPFGYDMSVNGISTPNDYALSLAYDSLLSFKHGPEIGYESLALQPDLAQQWETPDAQSYTFHLRKGVQFANLPPFNGRELTSADPKWTYEYWSRTGQPANSKLPASSNAWMFQGIDSVQTPDPYTLVVRFTQAYVPFTNYSASYFNPIVPHEIFDQDGNLTKRIIGTGPYQLDVANSQTDTRLIWKKNPSYWDSGKPYIDEIDWLVIQDDLTAYAAFQAKQVDIVGATGETITEDIVQRLRKNVPDAILHQHLPFGPSFHVNPNARTGATKDVRVRQAMSYAIDRDEFIKTFSGGKGLWVLGGAFPDSYSQQEIKQIVSFDLARAKQLLDAAGFSNGLDVEVLYPATDYGQGFTSELQLLQAQWKKAGINLTLKGADKQIVRQIQSNRMFDVQIQRTLTNLTGDVDSALYQTFRSGLESNISGADDPDLDALLEAERREFDAAKRKDIVRQAVKRISDQAYRIAVFRAPEYQFWQPYVKGYAPNFGNIQVPQTDSWVEK